MVMERESASKLAVSSGANLAVADESLPDTLALVRMEELPEAGRAPSQRGQQLFHRSIGWSRRQ